MKNITNEYKNNIAMFGRELDSKITYEINGVSTELGNAELNSVSPHYEGGILKSVMKQLDIDSNVEIPEGTILNYQFGVKIGNSYEYINYGNYIVYKVEKQEDTYSYKITCYDKMLSSMIDYEAMEITYPITIRDYLSAICNKLGLTFANASDEFANYNRQINNELYLDNTGASLGYTFRDVIDEIAQVTASTICINNDDELEIRYINELIDEATEVEGTNITITNNKSNRILDLELNGNTQQDGTPTPDSPVEIENVTGLQNVNVCGKNVFDFTDIKEQSAGITTDDDGWITVVGDNSSGSSTLFKNYYTNKTDRLKPNTTYKVICEIKEKTGAIRDLTITGNATVSQANTNNIIPNADIINNRVIVREFTTKSDFTNCTIMLRSYVAFSSGQSGSITFRISVIEDTSITPETFIYEPYIEKNYEINLGKNLFNSFNTNTTRITTDTDGTMNISNVSTANGYCETGRKLKELCPNLKVGDIVYIYIDTDFYESGTLKKRIYASEVWNDGATKTITQTMLNSTVVVYGGYETTSHVKVMITKSLDTNYSPYFTPIELNKIGNYQDKIYKDNGKWYLEKQIGKVVLDGSENWTDGSTNIFNVEDILPPHTYSTYSVNVLCDSYLGIIGYGSNSAFVSGTTNIDYACSLHSNGTTIRFKDIRYTSKEDLKTWLGTHNATLYFQLATPTYTEITNEELIEQLESIELLEGTNNITITSEDLATPIKLEYISKYDGIDEKYLKDINVNFGEKYGPVNSIVLSRAGESDNVYLRDEESVEENGLCEIKISENQIMNFNDRADYLEDILNQLDGLEYYINDFSSTGITYYELCDLYNISIEDNNYKCVMFNDEVNITQGLEELIHTDMPEESETDYKKADKTDRKINQTYIIANKQEGEIVALTSRTTTLENETSNMYTIDQVNQLVQTAETGITNTFSEAGGNNIFRNTGLWFQDNSNRDLIYPSLDLYPSNELFSGKEPVYEYWTGNVEKMSEDRASNQTALLLQEDMLGQRQEVPNGIYTISFKYQKLIELANIKCYINDVEYQLTETDETEFVETIEVKSQYIEIDFESDINNGCEIYDLMVNAGSVKLAYSQNQNETTTDTVNISKGITITSSDTETTFKANSDGVRIYDSKDLNLPKTKFTDKGTETDYLKVKNEAEIVDILIQKVGSHTWLTKI